MHDSEVSISRAASMTKATPRALRIWEARGLLSPAKRTKGGQRLYSRENLDTISVIRALQTAGYSLEEISSTDEGGETLLHRVLRGDDEAIRVAHLRITDKIKQAEEAAVVLLRHLKDEKQEGENE